MEVAGGSVFAAFLSLSRQRLRWFYSGMGAALRQCWSLPLCGPELLPWYLHIQLSSSELPSATDLELRY